MSKYFFNEQLRNHVMDKLRITITELVSDNSLDEIRTMLNDNEVTNGELISDIQDLLSKYDNGRNDLGDLVPDEVLERYDI